MAPPKEVIELYHLMLRDRFGADDAKRGSETRKLTGSIERNHELLSKLEDKYIDDSISKDTYVRKRQEYQAKIDALKESLQMMTTQVSSFEQYLSYGCTLLPQLGKYYAQSPLPVRQKIVGSIFPGKLIFKNGMYRTTETNYFVELINCKSAPKLHKTERQTAIANSLPIWAPEAGLEPATL